METPISKRRKRTQRDYTLGFKLSIVELVEKGEMTYKQAQAEYGIQGRSTVLVWLRKHGTLDWSNPDKLPMSKSKETPAQKIKRLEKELENAQLKILLLDETINIVDKEQGGSYRKKLNARLQEVSKQKEK